MATRTEDDIEEFISSIDPATMRDGKHLREVAAARKNLEEAEERMQRAVDEARAAGDPWAMIGAMLRTSRQNAHRKYGRSSQEGTGRPPGPTR